MINLDALKRELKQAGYDSRIGDVGTGPFLMIEENFIVFGQAPHPTYDWIDIIRRHVAPVAPDPGLREAITKALCSHFCGPDDNPNDEWMTNAVKSVLSVLAEKPDTTSLMEAIKEYGEACVRVGEADASDFSRDWGRGDERAEKCLAVIKRMIEG